jgi:predicted regulator of Ras-like GTPase activity (Roadblock/LC7/MglB family)
VLSITERIINQLRQLVELAPSNIYVAVCLSVDGLMVGSTLPHADGEEFYCFLASFFSIGQQLGKVFHLGEVQEVGYFAESGRQNIIAIPIGTDFLVMVLYQGYCNSEVIVERMLQVAPKIKTIADEYFE